MNYQRWIANAVICCRNHYAPESLFFSFFENGLHSTLFADSLRTWYIYRERACQEIYNTNFSDMVNQCLWYNRNIRSRTKHYIYLEDGCGKGILTIFLIHHFQVVNFLKNWFWTLIFLVKIEGNLIFLWNEFLVHGLKILILRILIFLITLLLVCFMLIKSQNLLILY